MLKWSTSLVLVLALAGSAWAGVPMHAGEHSCPMAGMADCCRKAQSHSTTPEVYAARLCCSLNCSMPGTTGPGGTASNLLPGAPALHNAITPVSALTGQSRLVWTYLSPEHNQHSPPIYIRHLALLI
jgi:hypothetical protein